MKPGIYDMSRADYDADPAPAPGLNASTAKIMLERSCYHAKLQHPRLNPEYARTAERKFDVGHAAHDLLFNEGRNISVIDHDDYKTKAAREARDAALRLGLMPIKRPEFEAVSAMVRAARPQLAQHADLRGVLDKGQPEATLLWQEGEAWCRARVDWLPPVEVGIFVDYKTTAASANPEQWARMAYDQGCDVQDVFYRRGLEILTGRPWECRFIVQETEPPYALSVCALPPSALAMGRAKTDEALRMWRWCMERDYWPGYPRETAYIEPPPWIEGRWADRETRREVSGDVLELGIRLQAPDDWKGLPT